MSDPIDNPQRFPPRSMLRMQSPPKPHVCPFCRKRFAETEHLEQHMRAKHCWRQESSHATETTDA